MTLPQRTIPEDQVFPTRLLPRPRHQQCPESPLFMPFPLVPDGNPRYPRLPSSWPRWRYIQNPFLFDLPRIYHDKAYTDRLVAAATKTYPPQLFPHFPTVLADTIGWLVAFDNDPVRAEFKDETPKDKDEAWFALFYHATKLAAEVQMEAKRAEAEAEAERARAREAARAAAAMIGTSTAAAAAIESVKQARRPLPTRLSDTAELLRELRELMDMGERSGVVVFDSDDSEFSDLVAGRSPPSPPPPPPPPPPPRGIDRPEGDSTVAESSGTRGRTGNACEPPMPEQRPKIDKGKERASDPAETAESTGPLNLFHNPRKRNKPEDSDNSDDGDGPNGGTEPDESDETSSTGESSASATASRTSTEIFRAALEGPKLSAEVYARGKNCCIQKVFRFMFSYELLHGVYRFGVWLDKILHNAGASVEDGDGDDDGDNGHEDSYNNNKNGHDPGEGAATPGPLPPTRAERAADRAARAEQICDDLRELKYTLDTAFMSFREVLPKVQLLKHYLALRRNWARRAPCTKPDGVMPVKIEECTIRDRVCRQFDPGNDDDWDSEDWWTI